MDATRTSPLRERMRQELQLVAPGLPPCPIAGKSQRAGGVARSTAEPLGRD